MATTQNTYTGNGSTTNYSFTFEYLKQAHVKVTLDTVATTAFTFANATTISFTTAPASGVAIRIFRDTDLDTVSSTFFAGSAIKAEDLNENFTQTLYVTQESDFDAATAVTTANSAVTTANAADTKADTAITTANGAVTTANGAVTTANAADTKSDTAIADSASAVTTANTASTNASSAVTTANTASTNASAAVTTANTASTNASAAVATANTASTNASAAVTTANTANTTASTAVTTANGAVTTANAADTKADTAIVDSQNAVGISTSVASTVADLVTYTPITNIASIPTSPSDGDRVEVENSTGAGASALITGLPTGFTGNSSAVLRLEYDSSNTIWNFKQYLYRDPDARYIDDATGSVAATNLANTSVTPGSYTAADITVDAQGRITTAASGTISTAEIADDAVTAAKLADTAVTAGSYTLSSLTIDAQGRVTAASNGTPADTDKITEGNTEVEVVDTGTDGHFKVTTEGSERMRIDSSGNVGIGTSNPDKLLVIKGSDAEAVIDDTNNTPILRFRNNGASSAAIAITSTQEMTFQAGGTTERLRIDSSGNVGIGQSDPQEKLDVNGNIQIRVGNPKIYFQPSTDTQQARFIFNKSDGSYAANFRWNYSTEAYEFYAGSSNKFNIQNNGNVGIGSNAPTEKLEVGGNVKATTFIGDVTGDLTGNADTATTATSATNADTVDNLHAASFIRADADDTAGGDITFNGVVNIRNALDFADNDILRFGSGDDAEFFTNGSHMYLDLNGGIGNFYIRDGTTTRFTFDDNGNFTATGSLGGTLSNGQVRTATASSGVGNLGTYAFCTLRNNTSDRSAGYTTSGSNLRYSNANGDVSGTPNGSWRLMGRLSGNSGNSEPQETSVWLRYS